MSIYSFMFYVVQTLLLVYRCVLFASIIITWLPDLADTRIGYILGRISEPYLRVFRRFIPPMSIRSFQFDISSLIGLLVYYVTEQAILNVLYVVVLGVS